MSRRSSWNQSTHLSGPYGFIKIGLVCVSRAQSPCFLFYTAAVRECRVIARLIREDSHSTWLWPRTRRSRPPPHGTGSGFSHFSTPMCNRQRQPVSDGINRECEYSGGQWFLNHLCGWNRSASSLRGINTLVTRVGAESLQAGLCRFKNSTFTLFVFFGEMAGYLEDGWQLHCDDKVFMKWGSTDHNSQ